MRSLAAVAVAIWLGIMACFAFVVAPVAFGALDREAAGRLVGAIFPRYYLVGAVLGALALAALIAHRVRGSGRSLDWLPLALVLLMLAFTLYAWQVVLPAAHAAREAMRRAPPAQAQVEAPGFTRLHRLSTILNGAVMIAGAAFVAIEAVRRP
jgi:hypothetical protein